MNLHYKTSFDIVPNTAREDVWGDLVRLVRNWVENKLNAIDPTTLRKPWFYNGGKSFKGFDTVITERFSDQETHQNYWALKLEQPGTNEYSMYRFHTDIGIEQIPEKKRFRLSIRVRYFVHGSYVGSEPQVPISCPKLVKDIVSHSNYTVYSGKLCLSNNDIEEDIYGNSFARVLKIGEGNKFLTLLQTERLCPIILVSRADNNQPKIDVANLSSLLAGSALVFVESEDSYGKLHKELVDMKPAFEEYRCTGGQIRVYKPSVNFKSPTDYKRHRYFRIAEIDSEGSEAITQHIFSSILRRPFAYESEYVMSTGDVERKKFHFRIEHLKKEGGDSKQFIQLYEEEIDELNKKLSEWQQMAENYDNLNMQLQDEKRKLEEKNQALQYQLQQRNTSTQERDSDAEEQSEDLNKILIETARKSLTPHKCLEIVAEKFGENIKVLDNAYTSARKSGDFQYCHKLLYTLWLLCSKGYQKLCEGEPFKESLENVLGKNRFAARESETIENNQRARKERTFTYRGNDLLMLAHLKIGTADNTAETIRVHFTWEQNEQKIIIGHCGQHLYIP